MYANLYLNAADQLGLKYRIEDKQAALVYIFNEYKEILLASHNLSLNTKQSVSLSRHKEKASTLLQRAHIPVPAFAVFDNSPEAIQYALEKVKDHVSIVIKPNAGSNAKGISIDPTTQVQVRRAVKEAFKDSKKVMIEEHISGHHYRITVLDDEIIAVTQRIPAYITSDGIHTVEKLIEKKNNMREKRELPLIILREKDYDYLKSARVGLSHMYATGQNIRLQHGCDYEIGGERVRIDVHSIPRVNQELFIKAIRTLNLRFGGIDYISPDITLPYTQIHTAINEINSSPHQDVHHFDRYPHENYAAKRIIEKIFEKKVEQ